MRYQHSLPHAQRGVALIVTLFILLVVTFMGLVAMRTGLMQVAMSTNSQVSVVLFHNADAGTALTEDLINADMEFSNGPNGPITLIRDNPGLEVVGCLTKSGGLELGTGIASKRLCDLGEGEDRSSGREVVAVQVSLRAPVDASGKAKTAISYGTDDSVLPGGGGTLVAVYSTSVMPAFGSATTSTIEGCLAKPQDGTSDNVTNCLTNANASFQTLVQEFVYGYGGYK